ncbi:MAG: hypothetical protein AAB851_03605, partial [Patescibacteria group bacterium]
IDGSEPPPADAFESTDGLDEDTDLKLLEQNGDTLGKTSFGAWMQTKPGTTSTLSFMYLLPDDIINEKNGMFDGIKSVLGFSKLVSHSILVQSQSGVASRKTRYSFDAGKYFKPVSSTEKTPTSFRISENTDGYFGMVLEKMSGK